MRHSSEDRLFTAAFVGCSLANFLQGLAFNLYLHFPGFLHRLGADEVRIGLLFGLTATVAVLMRPPIGRAMDSLGRRRMILAGSILNVLVCSLYLTVGSLGPWIYLVRSLHGFTEAILFTAFFALAADIIPDSRRTEGLALYGVSGMLPISLGGLLGDVILADRDYAWLFAASAAIAAASLLVSLPLRDPDRSSPELPNRGFFAALGQRDLRPLWFIGIMFATALASYFTFLKVFVMERGIGSVGGFFSAYAVSAIALRLSFGWLPDRVGPKRVLFPALGLLSVGLVILAAASNSRDLLLAGSLCGLGHGFVFPILSSLVVERARLSERGAALSIFTALFDAGVLIGSPLLGAVIHTAGYTTMFAVTGIALVVASAVFARLDAAAAPLSSS